MKKLAAAIAAAFLLTLGLVTVSEAPALAACPYSACINTTTTVSAPASVKAGRSASISVSVSAPGNTKPSGTVNVNVTKSGGGTVYNSTQPYTGTTLTFVTPPLWRGYYHVTATFTPATNSVFNGSSASTSIHAKKQKHHHHHGHHHHGHHHHH